MNAADTADLTAVRAVVESGEFTQHTLDLGLARSTCNMRGPQAAAFRAVAEYLVDQGADPNGEYGGNYGPIILAACEFRNPIGIQFLLEHGADANADPDRVTKYPKENTPLGMLLSTYGRGNTAVKHEAISLLQQYGAVAPPAYLPPFVAIHRGDTAGLAALLKEDPGLLARTWRDMPGGNISLRGATLLHMAVEFVEVECADLLIKLGGDPARTLNIPAQVIQGVGGQTPVFHAIASNGGGASLPILRHLVERYGSHIDWSASATFTRYGKARETPVTPLQFAEECVGSEVPNWMKITEVELALLRTVAATRRGS